MAVPSLANSFIALVKDTSLAAAITVPELFQAAQRIVAVTYEPLILYSEAALIYLVLSSLLSWLQAAPGAATRALRRLPGGARVIALSAIEKRFGGNPVLRGVDLAVPEGQRHRADRPVGLGQVDAAALREPAGDPAGRDADPRRHPPRPSGPEAPPAGGTCSPCAARPAWCSRTSSSSPTAP